MSSRLHGVSENEFVFITKDGDKTDEIKVRKDEDGNIWINGEEASEEDLEKLKKEHGLHMMPVMAGKMAFFGKAMLPGSPVA